MTERLHFLLVGALLVCGLGACPAHAQGVDPRNELAVCSTPHLASSTYVAGDGCGGVIVTWVDFRSDTLGDVYVQRVNSKGLIEWKRDGVAVCSAPGAQTRPTVVADGTGGAFVAWQDTRGGDPRVYFQRVNQFGLPILPSDGLPVHTAAGRESLPVMAEDGDGGAFVAWLTDRGGPPGHYVQRIGPDGVPLWPGDGVVIDTSLGKIFGFPPSLLASGHGQVVALTQKVGQVVIRKFGEQGQPLWSADGVSPCASCNPSDIRAIPDGAGGADLVWTEIAQTGERLVVAQRISINGALQWGPNGKLVFRSPAPQELASIASTGDGGAFVAWRNGDFFNPRIFAQRLAPDGAKLWGESGIRAAPVGRGQSGPILARGNGSDLLMLWQMVFESADYDMFLQRFDTTGAAQWEKDGMRLPTSSQSDGRAHIEADGSGGAIVVWEGTRDETAMILAERINPWGFAGPAPARAVGTSVFLWSPAPNPTKGEVAIRVAVRSTLQIALDVVDVSGRHVKSIMSGVVPTGVHSFAWDGTDDNLLSVAAGVYVVLCRSASGTIVTKVHIVP